MAKNNLNVVKIAARQEELSVEYSPFFAKGIDGMASSELVVTQGFDFPTLHAARQLGCVEKHLSTAE